MAKSEQPITYRLDDEIRKMLVAEAEAHGESLTKCSERIVRHYLMDTFRDALFEEIRQVKESVKKARADQATFTVALLVKAAKMPESTAQKWVEDHLRR